MNGQVTEIFESMQGEGIYLGERQIFVRLFGCNLKCSFCDTRVFRFKQYQPQELVNELLSFGDIYHSVSFTGGEPLLQKDFLKETLKLSRAAGFKNYLETNGTLPDELSEIIDLVDIVSMDFKLPSSTGGGDLWQKHRRFLEVSSASEVFVKAVVNESTVEEDISRAIEVINSVNPTVVLVLQPDSRVEFAVLKKKIDHYKGICARNNIITCIIPQVHKIAGVK
ncbi:MAG: 7-carboxy-7-deazaguanine synthase QueE [Candidatus Omnitrophica bacterium]|jgi:organic radical activating enzyme|nr:7-carboxy-7-deazaguanine synthase QueE [Candidatus Omnitrophota bacterium]MDD5079705.1 7-carboxy-7-deazaguanine synthase QueE [Candidatus Omnitrophota bacterium]